MGSHSHPPRHLPRRSQNYLYERSPIKPFIYNNTQQLETGITFRHIAPRTPATGYAPLRPVDSDVSVGVYPVCVLCVDQWGVEERPGLERA